MPDLPARSCDRARSWISLSLDCELSELEFRLLDAHLKSCVDCRAFEDGVRQLTSILRAQPLVPLERPIVVPRQRRSVVRLASLASAAAAVAVVTTTALFGFSGSSEDLRSPFPRPSVEISDLNDIRSLRRAQVTGSVTPPRPRFVQRSGPDAF